MTPSAAPVLEVNALRKAFGGNVVVDNASLTVRDGLVTSLIGPNGAGKTTLFNIITGFLPADSGAIRYRGKSVVHGYPHVIVGLGVARTFQELRLFPHLSALENVAVAVTGQPGERLGPLFMRWRRTGAFEKATRRRALELLEFVGLPGRAGAAPEEMSYGQQKRLSLARVLATEAAVICLDEPAAGLDPEAVGLMVHLLRDIARSGRAVLVIEHNLELVRDVSDRVVFLNLGQVVLEGSAASVLDDPRVLAGFLGI